MTNVHKAINAKLEILQHCIEIERLQEIIDDNVSISQMRNPTYVECDPNKIQAAIEENGYVGHKLIYKDVELHLYTDNGNKPVARRIFAAVMGESHDH